MHYSGPIPTTEPHAAVASSKKEATIKCVIWDLDETLWQGTLLDGGGSELRPGIAQIVRELDARGILQSIASKNDHEVAWPVVESFGLGEFFLHPKIGWSGKAQSIQAITEQLGIALDAVAFVDDQAVERDEVAFYLPQVTVMDAAEVGGLLERPDFRPRVITDEARMRRRMYLADIARSSAEEQFSGAREAFLQTLDMRISIHPVKKDDLARAEELTVRTNQLNTTGRVYSYDELESLAGSPDHLLLAVKLEDRYGSSGTVGLALVEKAEQIWTIRLLIMSCRVVTRGVGMVLIGHLLHKARHHEVRLRATFAHTGRNRQMYVTYKFAGFREAGEESGMILLEHDLQRLHALPAYVAITSELE